MQQDTIENILNGDLDAYDAVVRQYQRMLLGYAAHRLADVDAAQEVVQLTFIRAYEQLADYQPERDFGVWLCVICKHFILTELEPRRRESRNLEGFSHALQLRVGEHMAGASDTPVGDRIAALRECLQSLQSQAGSVIKLRYEQRKPCQSIAESLDRTVTWVTSTLSRAPKALGSCIAGLA